MIDVAVSWEDGEMKSQLVYVIANHMKKCFLNWNKDSVEDKVIIGHLLDMSKGDLKLKDSDLPLTDSSEFLKNKVKTSNHKQNKNRKKTKRRF